MQGSFKKSGETDYRIYQSRGAAFYALPLLLAVALTGMVITYPAASAWISQGVQAEFAGSDLVPDVAPTQLAKPPAEIKTVRAN